MGRQRMGVWACSGSWWWQMWSEKRVKKWLLKTLGTFFIVCLFLIYRKLSLFPYTIKISVWWAKRETLFPLEKPCQFDKKTDLFFVIFSFFWFKIALLHGDQLPICPREMSASTYSNFFSNPISHPLRTSFMFSLPGSHNVRNGRDF